MAHLLEEIQKSLAHFGAGHFFHRCGVFRVVVGFVAAIIVNGTALDNGGGGGRREIFSSTSVEDLWIRTKTVNFV